MRWPWQRLLRASGGTDPLAGGQGADTLKGGDGDDRLMGGDGQDHLVGGAGSDRFAFTSVNDSAAGAGDTIADFEAGEILDLGRIDADTTTAGADEAFTWLGAGALTSTAGELRYVVSGSDVTVQGDVDGDGGADIEITLSGVSALTAADFIL